MTRRRELTDRQARRYARHVVLPEIDTAGQLAIMDARVGIAPVPWTPAELLTAQYLAAAGIGAIEVTGIGEAVTAAIASRGPDTLLVHDPSTPLIEVAEVPAWWPHAEGDAIASSFWRAGITATRWLADVSSAPRTRS
ncbi:MAG: hypothetical protein AB7P03_12755 [Kofleriaceae bacterium]